MMKVDFSAKVQATFVLTKDAADMLFDCSAAHYDDRCRAASSSHSMFEPTNCNGKVVPGVGFIQHWRNMAAHAVEAAQAGESPWTITASFDQLDTACKCMERGLPNETPERRDLRNRTRWEFRHMLHHMNDLFGKWQDTKEIVG